MSDGEELLQEDMGEGEEDEDKGDTYLFKIDIESDENIFVNARHTKHKVRYVNHCCDPNLEALPMTNE